MTASEEERATRTAAYNRRLTAARGQWLAGLRVRNDTAVCLNVGRHLREQGLTEYARTTLQQRTSLGQRKLRIRQHPDILDDLGPRLGDRYLPRPH